MKTRTLNLDQPLLDIEGQPTQPHTTIGKALGRALVQAVKTNEGDILKYFGWAGELSKTGKLNLDEADSKVIKKFVVEDRDLYVIAKAPILKAIDKLDFK